MDELMQATIGADLEVERWLADYARARLTPDSAAKARSRARVMREARLALASQAEARLGAAAIAVDRVRGRRRTVRRGAALLLAAGLSVGLVGGALAASSAGGGLYDARIWLEAITLPAGGPERAAAELVRLEARMTELEAAVRSGDRGAAAAALAAYEAIADEAIAEVSASGDEAAIAKLTALLDRHVRNLERVAGLVPSPAADSINWNIERAILHNDAAIERIQAKPDPPPQPGVPNSVNGVGPNVQPQKSAKPTATPQAAATEEPAAAEEPVVTPKPHPTAKPQPTPKPAPTPRPPNSPSGQAGQAGQADH
jgi:hypothetical protein